MLVQIVCSCLPVFAGVMILCVCMCVLFFCLCLLVVGFFPLCVLG